MESDKPDNRRREVPFLKSGKVYFSVYVVAIADTDKLVWLRLKLCNVTNSPILNVVVISNFLYGPHHLNVVVIANF